MSNPVFEFKKGTIVRLVGTLTNEELYATTLPKTHEKAIPNYADRVKADPYLQRGLIPVYEDGNWYQVPIVTATAIRARLRHAAADHIIRRCAELGKPLTLKQIYSLKVGQVGDALSNEELQQAGEDIGIDLTKETLYRQSHPLESLYGLFKLHGSLAVSIAFPVYKSLVEQCILGGARHELNPQFVLDNTNEVGHQQYTDRRLHNSNKSLLTDELKELEKALKPEIKKLKKDENGKLNYAELSETGLALQAQIEEKKAQIKAHKDSQDGMGISTQMTLHKFVTPVGTKFKQTITLLDLSSPTPSSLLIYGLNALSKYPKLGAYKSSGGEFSFDYEVFVIDDERDQKVGNIKLGGFKPAVTDLEPLGKSWWDQAVADTSWHDKG